MLPSSSAVIPSGCAAPSGRVAKVVAGVRCQASATPASRATSMTHRMRARLAWVMAGLLTSVVRVVAERARCAQGGDAGRIILQQRAEDLVGVLAERGRRGEVGGGARGL